MKFKLFGGLDCPDAVLAQLSLVSQLSPSSVTSLCEFVINALLSRSDVTSLADVEPLNEAFLSSKENSDYFSTFLSLHQATTSGNDGGNPTRGKKKGESATRSTTIETAAEKEERVRINMGHALVALHTVVSNVVRFSVTPAALTNELSMLGLGTDVAEVISTQIVASFSELYQSALTSNPTFCSPIHPMETLSATILTKQSAEVVRGEDGSVAVVPDDVEKFVVMTVETATSSDEIHHGGPSSAEVHRSSKVFLEFTVDKAMALLAELVQARRALLQHNTFSAT